MTSEACGKADPLGGQVLVRRAGNGGPAPAAGDRLGVVRSHRRQECGNLISPELLVGAHGAEEAVPAPPHGVLIGEPALEDGAIVLLRGRIRGDVVFCVERLIEGERFACAVVVEVVDGAAALIGPMLDFVAQLATDRGGKGDTVDACVLICESSCRLRPVRSSRWAERRRLPRNKSVR